MASSSKPRVTFQIIPASQLATVTAQKILIVGQMLAAGSATSGALTQAIGNASEEDALFGQRSHLAGMIRAAKKVLARGGANQPQMDAIPIDDDGGATEGTGVLTITGPATASGSIIFAVGSGENHEFTIDIADTDTATAIGDDLVTAITADADAPFTAANVAGVVTITAANGGTLCNTWTLKVSGSAAGVAVAITAWTGGATAPTVTGIFDVVGSTRYQTVVYPDSWDLDEVQTFLDDRFNADNIVLDGAAVVSVSGTLSAVKALALPVNSQSVVMVGLRTVSVADIKGNAIVEMPDVVSAQLGAIRAMRLTEGALLSQINIVTGGPLDAFGGPAIASLPYHNTSLADIALPNSAQTWTEVEQADLEDSGVAVIGINRALNGMILSTQTTTYLTDGAGNPDTSYKFLNTVDTVSVIRETYFENLKSQYAQFRLTDGALIAGRSMANAASIKAFLGIVYNSLSQEALVQAGDAAFEDFVSTTIVTVDVGAGSVTITMAPLLVGQLREFTGTIQVNFSTGS